MFLCRGKGKDVAKEMLTILEKGIDFHVSLGK